MDIFSLWFGWWFVYGMATVLPILLILNLYLLWKINKKLKK